MTDLRTAAHRGRVERLFLRAVLEDPGAVIQRDAIFFAGLPRDVLVPPEPGEIPSRWWRHGRPEWFNAGALAQRAFVLIEQQIEPG